MTDYRVLRPPATDPSARLASRLAALEDRARQIERQEGRLINVQRIAGNNEQYSSAFGGTVGIYTNTVSGGGPQQLFQFAYTPPVDVWWEVTLNVGIVYAQDAAYNYLYGQVQLAPNDVDGQSLAYSLVTQHNSVNVFEPRHITRIYKLAAGTAYTVTAGFSIGGNVWKYYHGPNHLWMEAKAFIR